MKKHMEHLRFVNWFILLFCTHFQQMDEGRVNESEAEIST